MTCLIFEEYLSAWDKELDHEILPLVDHCTAHKITTPLKNIRTTFFPTNTTSVIQPCDQGIKTFKSYYRSETGQNVLNELDIELEQMKSQE